ncbi:MAG TPA: SpoIIE family protein phosphatase [Bacteroidia bacterium]|nr:SpoIIE family protein phosphatase [Bacteroidia bacterium]
MAFKFTIGRKIGTGFGVLLLLTLIAFIFTIVTITRSKQQTDSVVGQVTPSVSALKEYNFILQKSQTLISKWFYVQSPNDDPAKTELRNLISKDYPHIKAEINALSNDWSKEEKEKAKSIIAFSDGLFRLYQEEIMTPLNSWESYQDATIKFTVNQPFEDSQEKIKMLYNQLNDLITQKEKNAETTTEQMFSSFNFLDRFVKLLGIGLIIGGILIAIFTTRSITKPIQQLKKMLLSMGLGILPKERISYRTDEIGEMGIALNSLVESMESTTEFAKQTGKGNFDAYYKPLSKDDSLGHALLKMRDSLSENERVLEQKVIERTEQVVKQKEEIEVKTKELEILFKQVTDSIHYAKRIQEAILPPNNLVKQILPDSFVLYKPKDIVSGDFYWIDKKGDWSYFAAVDCTGHGVPGAFMSIVGYNLLKDILKNTDSIEPSIIMDKMNDGVANTLHTNTTSGKQTKDGMDMTLCALNYKTLELQFSGAFNPLYIIRNNELIQYKADKFPVGMFIGEKQNFTNNTIQLQKGDSIYIFSDGYADQFGGPRGKKFMAGNFRQLLLDVSKLPIERQKTALNQTIEEWRGNLEQVDDMLIIGVQV